MEVAGPLAEAAPCQGAYPEDFIAPSLPAWPDTLHAHVEVGAARTDFSGAWGVTNGPERLGPDPETGTSAGAPTRAPPVPALTASSCFRFTSSASSRRVSGICGGAALLCIAMLEKMTTLRYE